MRLGLTHRNDDDDHDGKQLQRHIASLQQQRSRRDVLKGLLGLSVLGVVAACGDDTASDVGLENADGTCNVIPEETAGPYPGDGSNGVNALTLSGIVRSDIRSSIGDLTGTAEGVALTVTLTLLDESCAPLAGRAVYLWHCNIDGDYSMYDLTNQNYLRGVQVSDADGKVTFTTIFPGCYSGRWPHIHFEVYESVELATSADNVGATSQLALPQAACDEVYNGAEGYETSVENLANNSLESDNVFSDGTGRQMATVRGSVDEGYTATLSLTVRV